MLPTANDGAVATWGVDPTTQLRQNTLLEEAGVKFDLLDKALFISSAIFKQERTIPSGAGGLVHSLAHIKGAEIELNYQPDPHFFATASYSYLHTVLDTPHGLLQLPGAAGYQLRRRRLGRGVSAKPDVPGSGRAAAPVQRARELQARIRIRRSGEHSGHGTRPNHPVRVSEHGRNHRRLQRFSTRSRLALLAGSRPTAATTSRP